MGVVITIPLTVDKLDKLDKLNDIKYTSTEKNHGNDASDKRDLKRNPSAARKTRIPPKGRWMPQKNPQKFKSRAHSRLPSPNPPSNRRRVKPRSASFCKTWGGGNLWGGGWGRGITYDPDPVVGHLAVEQFAFLHPPSGAVGVGEVGEDGSSRPHLRPEGKGERIKWNRWWPRAKRGISPRICGKCRLGAKHLGSWNFGVLRGF